LLLNSENYKEYASATELIEYLILQYGLPDNSFEKYYFFQINKNKNIYMTTQGEFAYTNITQIGLPIYKGDFPKGYPTNAFIYRFGKKARKNVITINEKELTTLLNREGVPYTAPEVNSGAQIIKTPNNIIGRGWTRQGLLYLDTPKIWIQNLL